MSNKKSASSLISDLKRKTRSRSAFDRLNEESAYEIVRVGINPTDANVSNVFNYTSFPFDPITLLGTTVLTEILEASSAGILSSFDALTLTVENNPVTILNSVTINYQDGYSYDYSIRSLGYQINDPRYDTAFGSTLVTLA